MKEVTIQKKYNLPEFDLYSRVLKFHNAMQKNKELKLSDLEIEIMSYLMIHYSEDKNIFKGEERRKMLIDLDMSSQNLAIYLSSLVTKRMLMRASQRGSYSLNPNYGKVRDLLKSNAVIKYEFIMEIENERDLQ